MENPYKVPPMLLFRAPSTYTKFVLPLLYVSNKGVHKCEIQLIAVFEGECTHLSVVWGFNIIVEQGA
jgi:hypothetical protein